MVTKIRTRRAVKKIVHNAEWYVDKDKRYFLRMFQDAKPILQKAEEITKGLHITALSKKNMKMLRAMVVNLNHLESQERWQQIRTRYPKLKEAMEQLMTLPISGKAKVQIPKLLEQEHYYEADLLRKTVDILDPLIRDKQPDQINNHDWGIIEKTASRLLTDLRNLIIITENLEKILEESTSS
jgi:hypothetical protein|tara:strand:+ start:1300 stop:1848 length:549 start_codon:yes stop_codon:yes gene_type:complete